MTSSQYTYAPLDAPDGIRLLSILPGAAPGQVAVDIFHTTLGAHPAYEALSYAWGRADFAHEVSTGSSSSLAVSTNLYEALQRLRRRDVKRTMWIDALCINQEDVAERSRQVGKMRDIYRGADQVVVWIGEESATSTRAIDFVRLMGSEKLDTSDGAEKKVQHPDAHIRYGWPVLYSNNRYWQYTGWSSNQEWEALDELVGRPWWSRTWVVQEVWSARNVILQCGAAIIRWRTIQEALNYEDAWDDMGQTMLESDNTDRLEKWKFLKRRYGLALHITRERVNGRGLSDILWNTWDRDSADPRDKVFAALELIADETRPHMRADYTKPMVEVYKEAARNIIDLEDHLDILLAANGLSRTDWLPSWVPDWRREANDHRPTLFVNRDRLFTSYYSGSVSAIVASECGFEASGKRRPVYEFDDEVLKVSASLVDNVVDLTPEFHVDPDPPLWELDNSWRTRQPVVMEESLQRGINEAIQLASTATGIATTDEGLQKTVQGVLAAGWRRDKTLSIARNVMRRRKFFVTRGNRLCIGPCQAEKGDEVWIVAGCNYPIILRKDDKNGHYGMVGEAYGKLCGIVITLLQLTFRDSTWYHGRGSRWQ